MSGQGEAPCKDKEETGAGDRLQVTWLDDKSKGLKKVGASKTLIKNLFGR